MCFAFLCKGSEEVMFSIPRVLKSVVNNFFCILPLWHHNISNFHSLFSPSRELLLCLSEQHILQSLRVIILLNGFSLDDVCFSSGSPPTSSFDATEN